VRFWDSSAIVPLLAAEPRSELCRRSLDEDPVIAAWWGTRIECTSAIARLDREQVVGPSQLADANRRLAALAASWQEIQPTEPVRRIAERLLRVHVLRAADALQLAAAVTAADATPSELPFVTFDARLARAAEREGFPVLEPA
jgi:predicted nucleic acid-binding protein